MANSSTTSKPPPSGKITISLSYELLKKIRLLDTKLAASIQALALKKDDALQDNSLVHVTLTNDDEKKLEDTSLVQQEISLDETRRLFAFLCAQVRNKELKAKEILAIEEYKIALLEACRTAICDNASASFKLRKKIYTPVVTLQTNLPALKLPLLKTASQDQKKSFHVTLEQLKNEFDLIIEEEAKRKENNRFINSIKVLLGKLGLLNLPPPKNPLPEESSKKRKEIDEALKTYKQAILDIPLFQESGLTESYHRSESRKSFWKKLARRIGFTVPLALQIFVSVVYNVVEMMGAQSFLLLIPNITTAALWGISIPLIVLSSVLDIAFGLKIFKETYGFSYLWRDTKTYLQAAEKELPLTNHINDLLLNHNALHMDSITYKQFTDIAHLASKDIQRKVANTDSPFSNYRETTTRKVIRGGMVLINTIMAISGAYFIGNLLLDLLPAAFFASIALGPAGPIGVTILTTCFIVILAAISIALVIHQYRGAIFNLINPVAERFAKIKEFGSKLVKNIGKNDDIFSTTITKKREQEQKELMKVVRRKKADEPDESDEPEAIDKVANPLSLSGKHQLTLLGGSSSNSSSRSVSTDSLVDEDSSTLEIRTQQQPT